MITVFVKSMNVSIVKYDPPLNRTNAMYNVCQRFRSEHLQVTIMMRWIQWLKKPASTDDPILSYPIYSTERDIP